MHLEIVPTRRYGPLTCDGERQQAFYPIYPNGSILGKLVPFTQPLVLTVESTNFYSEAQRPMRGLSVP